MTYKEIIAVAKKLNIHKETVDKDWILGHFLNAMFHYKEVREKFIFKGGTCLKKCYFDDYRFSEDLDFTLTDSNFLIDEKLFLNIIKIAERNSTAKFYLKKIKSQIYKDIPQGYEITVLYWGAYHKPNQFIPPTNRWLSKIKIDISYSEKTILKPEIKKIFHSYSDCDSITNEVTVYPLNEIVSEKLRSLIQRNRSRDIYDLYYLSNIIKAEEYEIILNLLKQKAMDKGITFNRVEDFVNQDKYRKNKRAWESSLSYHLPKGELVDYDIAYDKVENFVKLIITQ